MKKILLITITLFCVVATAQKKAKIKGNKNVISEERTFDFFSSIELNDKIKLNLKQSESSKLVIEADENLHDVVDSDIENGTLVLSLNKRITGSKRFILTLYIEDLDVIKLHDDSEILSDEKFEFFDLNMILNDKSDVEMHIDAQFFRLESNEKSRGSVTVKADSISIHMKESSKIKYTINTQKLLVNYEGSSTGEFVGKTSDLVLVASDNATFKGSELEAKEITLTGSNGTNSYVHAKNNLALTLKNKSKVYIFGSPLIEIKSFEDASSIFKRESMRLLEKL